MQTDMPDTLGIACLIFAAGKGARFGANKMSYKLKNGLSILEHTIQNCRSVFDQVYVVSNKDRVLEDTLSERGINSIKCANANQGMSQSVMAGVNSTHPKVAWLMVLGDMPFVKSDTLKTILEQANEAAIVIPRYNGAAGNPVLIGTKFRQSLTKLSGDKGAKNLIKSNADKVIYVDVDDVGILQDIDTREDAMRLQSQ